MTGLFLTLVFCPENKAKGTKIQQQITDSVKLEINNEITEVYSENSLTYMMDLFKKVVSAFNCFCKRIHLTNFTGC